MVRPRASLRLVLALAIIVTAPAVVVGDRSETERDRAQALSREGIERLDDGDLAHAYESFAEAQRIYENLGDAANSAKVLGDMGKIQTDLSQYPLAIEHLLRARELLEELGDRNGQMVVLNRLAVVHLELGEDDTALARFTEALELAEAAGSTERAAAILGNMGIVYAHRGDHQRAIEFYTRSLDAGGPDQHPRKVAIFHNNIGVQYARQDDFASALDHYLRSVTLLEQVGDQQLLGEGLNNVGEAYLKLGRLDEAEDAMKRALSAAESSGEKVTIQDCYLNLSGLYEARGDFSEALRSHKRYAELREEIFSDRKAAQIAELEARFETREKEDEIHRLTYEAELQEVQLEKHRQTLALLILCVTLLVVIVAILGIGYRRKIRTQRLLRDKNRQLDHLARELGRTDELRRELVSNVSHDLRSPLAVVQGYLESLLLKDEELNPAQRRRHLQIALAGSNRLTRLVSDLFDLSFLEARCSDVDREPFVLGELVQDSARQYRLLAEENGVDMVLDIAPSAPMVAADAALMERVIHNLLSNAVRFTPPGEGIEVRVLPDDDGIGVMIMNSGPGIPADEIPHLFDRYYSTSRGDRGTDGSGLGLAIVKRILDLHGIPINVSGIAGEYVAFCFRVPFAAARTAVARSRTAPTTPKRRPGSADAGPAASAGVLGTQRSNRA